MKWAGELNVASVDVEFLRSAFSAFLASARTLNTDGGRIVHPETGLPVDYLRVHEGVHPRPRVVYELISIIPSPRAAASALPHLMVDGRSVPIDDPVARAHLNTLSPTDTESRALVSVDADNEQLLRVSGVDEETAWHFEVERPARARKATGGGRVDAGPGRWFGGEVTFEASADVDRACSLDQRAREVADLTIEHRRFRVELRIEASRIEDRTVLEVRGTGMGRGVVRPAVFLVSLAFGRRIRKMLDHELDGLDQGLDQFRAEFDSFETPDDLAHEMLLSMFHDSSEPTTPS